jgi:hypothetical protein
MRRKTVAVEKAFLSRREFAAALGVCVRSVTTLIQSRQIKVIRIGAKGSKAPRVLIPMKELDRLAGKAA